MQQGTKESTTLSTKKTKAPKCRQPRKGVAKDQTIVYYTQGLRWLGALVEAIAEDTGKSESKLFIEAFCEYPPFRKMYPEIAENFRMYRTINGDK